MSKTERSRQPQQHELYCTHDREYSTKMLFVYDL